MSIYSICNLYDGLFRTHFLSGQGRFTITHKTDFVKFFVENYEKRSTLDDKVNDISYYFYSGGSEISPLFYTVTDQQITAIKNMIQTFILFLEACDT